MIKAAAATVRIESMKKGKMTCGKNCRVEFRAHMHDEDMAYFKNGKERNLGVHVARAHLKCSQTLPVKLLLRSFATILHTA